MEQQATTYYNSLHDSATKTSRRLSRDIATISIIRLLTVIAAAVSMWALWNHTGIMASVLIVLTVLFLALIKRHDRLFRRRALQQAFASIADDGLNRLNLRLEKAPRGEKYIDSRHSYSYDLDIFGEASVFSLLCTTTTADGEKQLAHHLTHPESVRSGINARQTAVKELSRLNDFRTRFRAYGMTAGTETSNVIPLQEMPSFKLPRWTRWATWIFPVAFATLTALAIAGMQVSAFFTITIVISLITAGISVKRVGKLHNAITATVNSISIYHTMLAEIEETQFQAPLLQEIQQSLKHDGVSACEASRRLARICSNLDQHYNWLSYLIFNVLMQWDYRQIHAANRWMSQFAEFLPKWQESLGAIDELSALASYSFNNPDYVFPTADTTESITIQASAMGHPLIGGTRCVRNGIQPMRHGDFMVVTGANMAGKSTYLRTVGVNYLLALIGAPVFAKDMIFTPATLCTGLRTTDSLHNNESYFFSELQRLQSIIGHADSGERLFVILDEILKGTNSVDKQKGSLALVRQLVNKGVTGIIATHDLVLGNLAEEFPENVSNYCFEAQIEGNKLTFSYQIHKGVAHNMNATFLMQRMGII